MRDRFTPDIPGGVVVASDKPILELIAFRNRNLQISDIEARYNSAIPIRKLVRLSQTLQGYYGRLELNVIRYPLNETFVLVDAESPEISNRQGLIRLAGFLDFFADKRDFSLKAT